MARRGSAPGERRGGRQRGALNKRTLERLHEAEREVRGAAASGKKLGKEVLDEFMHLFAGMAAVYQPLPPGVVSAAPGRLPDEAKFLNYANLAVTCAKALAPFQSPTFKAIQVIAPPDSGAQARVISDQTNVVTIDDPQALARVYKRMIAGVG